MSRSFAAHPLVPRAALLYAMFAACGVVGCTDSTGATSAASSSSVTAASSAPVAQSGLAETLSRLRRAELTRQVDAVTLADRQHRDPRVRRAALRALARIRGKVARDALLKGLRDRDAETRMWAAYGLGDDCTNRAETEKALVTTYASAQISPKKPTPDASRAEAALIRAVGRCGGPKAEATLLAWAKDPEAAAAAFRALGDVARSRRQLNQDTVVGLLALASGTATEPGNIAALYPLSQLDYLPTTTTARVSKVAAERARSAIEAKKYDGLAIAIRTLGRADGSAVSALETFASDDTLPIDAQVAAIDALKRHGKKGQRVLAKTLKAFAASTDAIASRALVYVAAIDAVAKIKPVREPLTVLQNVTPTETGDPVLARRYSQVRCAAARRVQTTPTSPLVRGCELGVEVPADPMKPVPGPLAAATVVGVLAKKNGTKLSTSDATVWKGYAEGGPVAAREAAIELLKTVAVPNTDPVLEKALNASESGVVATAASVLAKRPALLLDKAGKVDPAVPITKRLIELLSDEKPRDLEALTAVIDAAKSTRLKKAVTPLRELCRSPHVTVRSHAQAALRKLGGDKSLVCLPPKTGKRFPAEVTGAPDELKVELKVAGKSLSIVFDPKLTPLAAARFKRLVETGFLKGNTVHRVVPGFVVQFGSPTGDGYGAPVGYDPMACETSPVHFSPLKVGVALAGRDTGTTQFFVTLGDFPHLDGRYAWVGSASGPWHELVAGDTIDAVKIVSP